MVHLSQLVSTANKCHGLIKLSFTLSVYSWELQNFKNQLPIL